MVVSYSLRTQFGYSPSQGAVTYELGIGESIEWEPDYIPPVAINWRPEFVDMAGQWRYLSDLGRGEIASLASNDPAEIAESTWILRST